MVTYLYCVLTPPRAEAFPSGLTGLAGAAVRAVAHEDLESWVATIDETAVHATGNTLAKLALAHNDVVEAALATGRTPLPTRFGTRFADDHALFANLEERRAKLIDALRRVADAVEMSVLVVPTTKRVAGLGASRPRRNEPAAGRRYLEAIREHTKTEEQRNAEANGVAERVRKAVSVMTRGERLSSSSNGLSIAHLVARVDEERYRRLLSDLDVGANFRIIVAGPRAPYSFATE